MRSTFYLYIHIWSGRNLLDDMKMDNSKYFLCFFTNMCVNVTYRSFEFLICLYLLFFFVLWDRELNIFGFSAWWPDKTKHLNHGVLLILIEKTIRGIIVDDLIVCFLCSCGLRNACMYVCSPYRLLTVHYVGGPGAMPERRSVTKSTTDHYFPASVGQKGDQREESCVEDVNNLAGWTVKHSQGY